MPITAFRYCFSLKWCYGIRGPCTKNNFNQKFWTRLMRVMVCELRMSLVLWRRELSGYERVASNLLYHLKFKCVFSAIFLTAHTLNNLPPVLIHESYTRRGCADRTRSASISCRPTKVQRTANNQLQLNYLSRKKYFVCRRVTRKPRRPSGKNGNVFPILMQAHQPLRVRGKIG